MTGERTPWGLQTYNPYQRVAFKRVLLAYDWPSALAETMCRLPVGLTTEVMATMADVVMEREAEGRRVDDEMIRLVLSLQQAQEAAHRAQQDVGDVCS